MRLIAWPPLGLDLPPFTLLSDDQVLLSRDGDRLIARPPPTIAGRLEVRGVGIVEMPHAASAVVTVVIRMCKADAVERMPEPALQTLAGYAIPAFALFPFEPSAPLKVALAVKKALAG